MFLRTLAANRHYAPGLFYYYDLSLKSPASIWRKEGRSKGGGRAGVLQLLALLTPALPPPYGWRGNVYEISCNLSDQSHAADQRRPHVWVRLGYTESEEF